MGHFPGPTPGFIAMGVSIVNGEFGEVVDRGNGVGGCGGGCGGGPHHGRYRHCNRQCQRRRWSMVGLVDRQEIPRLLNN